MYYMTTNSKITGIVLAQNWWDSLGSECFHGPLNVWVYPIQNQGGHLVLSCFTTPMHTIVTYIYIYLFAIYIYIYILKFLELCLPTEPSLNPIESMNPHKIHVKPGPRDQELQASPFLVRDITISVGHSRGKWPIYRALPIKNCDFPWLC